MLDPGTSCSRQKKLAWQTAIEDRYIKCGQVYQTLPLQGKKRQHLNMMHKTGYSTKAEKPFPGN